MAQPNPYSGAMLNADLNQIRILVLAPGTGDDKLQGDFLIESLHYDDLHYNALSYTWSRSPDESAIAIGELSLGITKNLELALRHLRGPTRAKNVWLDAICINQSDDEENGRQVALMGEIYSKATRTRIWLGPGTKESDELMDHILLPESIGKEHPEDSVSSGAISEVMRHLWWKRVWVVQEALLSREAILQCGEKTVNFARSCF